MSKKAFKIASAAAVAASAFVAVNPAQAATAAEAEVLVKKAESLGGTLKWAISVEGSWDGHSNPDMKLFNDTKAAHAKAVAAVSTLTGSQKTALEARLNDKVKLYVDRAVTVIDAVSAGKKIEAKKVALEALLEKDTVTEETVKAYDALSTEIRKQEVLLSRVYGQTSRASIREYYQKSAEAVKAEAMYPVSVFVELGRLDAAITAKNEAEATTRYNNVSAWLPKVEKASFKTDLTAKFDAKKSAYEALKTPKVESVSAINGKELVIKFNKAVKKDSVITGTNLKTGVFTINNGEANLLTSAASLSADGKTLTLAHNTAWSGSYAIQLLANQAVTLDDKKVADYKSYFTAEDVTRAEVTGVTYVDKFTYDINFSEPVNSTGVLGFSYTDGTTTAITTTSITPSTDKKSVRVVLDGATLVNKEITVSLPSITDFANNISKPASTKLTVSDADKTKPAVTSVTTNGYDGTNTSFQIKLSEAVKSAPVTGITVNGAAVTASVDANDNTVINATVAGKVKGSLLVYIPASTFTDLNNNTNSEVGQFYTFTQDETAPIVTGSSVQRIGGVEYLVVTYSEDIKTLAVPATINFTSVDQYGMPTTTTDATPVVELHNVVDGKTKQVRIKLDSLTDSKAYKVTLAAGTVKDYFNNSAAEAKDLSFSTSDVDTGVGALNLVTVDATPASAGKITVTFSKPVNVASAQSVANYVVEDATVSKAVVTANGPAGATVELTLADDTVEVGGTYKVTVKPVQTFNSLDITNEVTTTSSLLKENVRPKFTSKVISNLTSDSVDVKVTFNDATITNGTGNDFELYVNGVATGKKINVADLTPAVAGSFNVSWSEVAPTNDVADLLNASSVKLVALDTIDIKDVAGNVVVVSDIVIK